MCDLLFFICCLFILLYYAPHTLCPAIVTPASIVKNQKSPLVCFYLVQIYPGAVELMQVIEEFIHIVGLGMKDFHNAYLMTGNLGKNQPTFSPQPRSR